MRGGVGVGSRALQKFRKKYFSGNYHVKFKNFSGKYVKFGHFVIFHAHIFGQNPQNVSPPKS